MDRIDRIDRNGANHIEKVNHYPAPKGIGAC